MPPSSQAIGYSITKATGRRRCCDRPAADLQVSARAGIVVTGTEVLSGRVSDRNGPWLAERLRELGVDLAYTAIVGDRPEDMEAALRFMAEQGLDVILTSGGLGPTADDLTAEVVGRFQGREMVLDDALAERIAEIVKPLLKRWPNLDRGDPGGQPQAGDDPRGRDGARAGGNGAGLVVPAPASATGPADGWPDDGLFRARRASCSRCGSRPCERRRCALPWRARSPTASGCCGCSGSPSRRSPRRCGWPSARAWSWSAWRSRRA